MPVAAALLQVVSRFWCGEQGSISSHWTQCRVHACSRVFTTHHTHESNRRLVGSILGVRRICAWSRTWALTTTLFLRVVSPHTRQSLFDKRTVRSQDLSSRYHRSDVLHELRDPILPYLFRRQLPLPHNDSKGSATADNLSQGFSSDLPDSFWSNRRNLRTVAATGIISHVLEGWAEKGPVVRGSFKTPALQL